MRTPTLLLATALLGTSAWAQDSKNYLQFGIGGVFSEEAEDVPGGSIGFDPGLSGSLTYGHRFVRGKRLTLAGELEAFYQFFAVDEDDLGAIPSAIDDDAKTLAFLLNGMVDWRLSKQYSIYGGLGVGFAKEIDYEAWDSGNLRVNDDDGAAFQGRLGLGFNLGGDYDVRIGYRYFKTQTVEVEDLITGQTSDIDVAQHSLELLFRWGL